MSIRRYCSFALCLALLIGPWAAVTTAHGKADKKLRVFNINEADVKPVALVRTPPVFPESLRTQRATAKVVTEFIIDPAGNVVQTAIVSSTDSRFNELCITAIKSWKFTPAMHKKKPVYCRAAQLLEFNVD